MSALPVSSPLDVAAPPAGGDLLEIDADRFQANFGHTPFLIGHRLASHPLFQLPRLVELSRRLNAEDVEYYAGKVPMSVAKDLTPRNGLSIEETIWRIEECCSWMGQVVNTGNRVELPRRYHHAGIKRGENNFTHQPEPGAPVCNRW